MVDGTCSGGTDRDPVSAPGRLLPSTELPLAALALTRSFLCEGKDMPIGATGRFGLTILPQRLDEKVPHASVKLDQTAIAVITERQPLRRPLSGPEV
jgi:hypothetical protein